MINRIGQIFLFIILLPCNGIGQDLDYGAGYQMSLINNPALTGSEGDGTLRLSYLNFYPGNSYNLHSVYLSYDSYFPSLHGGAGFYITDDYLGGIINDLRGGFSYAYFLQAGEDLFINAGLSASFYHRGYNFGTAILPDQIDPLGGVSAPSSEYLANSGQTLFDVGAGFTFITGKLSGGFSINHLAEPDLSEQGYSADRLKRKYFVHLAGDLILNKAQGFNIRPLAYTSLQGDYITGGIGTVFESNHLSVSGLILGSSNKNINIQTGFSINAGRVRIYYNYCFNIVSENTFIPVSLIHHTGLAFSLNYVDKRNPVKTINYPKL